MAPDVSDLPAMLLALWFCERRLAPRLAWIGLFLAGCRDRRRRAWITAGTQ